MGNGFGTKTIFQSDRAVFGQHRRLAQDAADLMASMIFW
jgi:hypothetical protein